MKTKIKGRLKELFPKAHLSKARTSQIVGRIEQNLESDAEQEDIDKAINDANAFFPFSEITKMDDRVASYEHKINELQSGRDDEDDDDEETPPNPGNQDDDTPAWAKAMMTNFKSLSADVSAIKSEKQLDHKKKRVDKIFTGSKVFSKAPERVREHFMSQVDFESETDLEDQVSGLEELYTTMVQDRRDKGNYGGAPPAGGDFEDKPSKEEIDSILDSI